MKRKISVFQKRIIRNSIIGGLLALIILTGSLYYFEYNNTNSPILREETQQILFTIDNNVETSFGLYPGLSSDIPERGPIIHYKTDLSDVANLQILGDNQKAKEVLATNGFVITEGYMDEFYQVYKQNYELGIPNFVSTDSMLHTFHVLYDYSLRFSEVDYFYDLIGNVTQYMYQWAYSQYNLTLTPKLQDACKRVTAFFAVPLILLHLNETRLSLPATIEGLVAQEIKQITTQTGVYSPITGARMDYTQFIVRGHYTRSDKLSQFFLTMMYYGLMPFYLNPALDMIDPSMTDGVKLTRMATIITKGVFSDSSNQTFLEWEHVYEPTTFYVGKADDLTLYQYKTLVSNISLTDLEDDTIVQGIISKAEMLPAPLILGTETQDQHWNVSTKGFRFMGQRFIPDSYFFQELVHDKVANRLFPSGLDIMNVLDSSRAAYHEQDQAEKYPSFLSQITKLREEVSSWNETVWTQNLYFLWFYTLLPLLNEKGREYASFMRTDAWSDKELMTALGSWAELRHDTVLYAKQSTGVKLGMPTGSDFGYVEPNPDLYARLYSLSQLLLNGLKSRGLLREGSDLFNRISQFSTLALQLKTISEKELRGVALSQDELNTINTIHQPLETIISMTNYNTSSDVFSEEDTKAAIIVDVHNDPNTRKVLEVGTGKINFMFVIVPDANGKPVLTQGATYSYYEFTQDMNHRLTDAEWHEMLNNGTAPTPPEWIVMLVVMKNEA